MRRRLALTTLAVLAAVAFATQAVATTSTKDPPGDLRGVRGLTTAEKLAIDIFRVEVSRAGGFLEVDLRVRGNLEQRMGRGHLRRGAAGITLVS